MCEINANIEVTHTHKRHAADRQQPEQNARHNFTFTYI